MCVYIYVCSCKFTQIYINIFIRLLEVSRLPYMNITILMICKQTVVVLNKFSSAHILHGFKNHLISTISNGGKHELYFVKLFWLFKKWFM